MLLPKVPISIFILSFKSRWHCLEDVAGAGEHLTAETGNEKARKIVAGKGRMRHHDTSAVSIARLANTNGECVACFGRVFAQVVRTGSSMICLTVTSVTPRL